MFTYEPATNYTYPPSEAANLEYSILSTILGGSPDPSVGSPPNVQGQSRPQASSSYSSQQPTNNLVNSNWPATSNGYSTGSGFTEQPALAVPPSDTALSSSTPTNGFSTSYQQSPPSYTSPTNGTTPAQGQFPEFNNQAQQQVQSSTLANYAGGQPAQAPLNHVSPTAVQMLPSTAVIPPTRSSSTSLLDRTVSTGTASWAGPAVSDLALLDGTSVYKSVTKPYDYTEGYHFLMKHLTTRYVRFNRDDII